jgi:hypothetical protein
VHILVRGNVFPRSELAGFCKKNIRTDPFGCNLDNNCTHRKLTERVVGLEREASGERALRKSRSNCVLLLSMGDESRDRKFLILVIKLVFLIERFEGVT